MLLVNLYGVPSCGKSSCAAYIFSKLKFMGVNAELVTEFAKDKVWEESKEVFNNQAYIFGKQYFRISRVQEKVDVVITDSPIMLSCFYNTSVLLGEEFNNLVRKVSNSFNQINYLLDRVKPYNPAGRFQTEEESDALKQPMIDFLESNNIEYRNARGCVEDADKIVDEIMKYLKKNK